MDFIFKSKERSAGIARHSDSIPADHRAFGSASERSQRDSEDLLNHVEAVSGHISTLVANHNDALVELASLRAERARLASLLDDETISRRRLDDLTDRLESENTTYRKTIAQLTTEAERTETALTTLQTTHTALHQQHKALGERLDNAESELDERTELLEQTRHALSETQNEVRARGTDLATLGAELDAERTARALEAEIAAKENAALSREAARLSGERGQLTKERDRRQAEAEAGTAQVVALKQELAKSEARQREAREELETLRTNSEMEISHLSARVESVISKSELVEKLLATARDRNATTDAELQTIRGEFRAAKTELAGAVARAERLAEDLSRSRTAATESEAARRTLAVRLEDAAARLRDSEAAGESLQREILALRREQDARSATDGVEIDHLRTSLEIARSEIEQIRTENALLSGHVETARAERARGTAKSRDQGPGSLTLVSGTDDDGDATVDRENAAPHAAE